MGIGRWIFSSVISGDAGWLEVELFVMYTHSLSVASEWNWVTLVILIKDKIKCILGQQCPNLLSS